MILSYDAGFGYVKSLSQQGNRLIFPSIVGEIPPHSSLDIFSNGTEQIEAAGQQWLIGNSALRQSILTTDLQNSDWVLSAQWRAMLLYAISEVTEASRVDIEVVTGLPFQDYVNRELRQQFKESLLGAHSIQRPGRPHQKVIINEVKVLTQNFAPIFCHLPLKQDAIVGVLNIGSHTVEMATVLLSSGGRPEAIRSQCKSEPLGTRATLPRLRDVLASQRARVRYSDYEIDKGLQSGQVDGVTITDYLDSFAQSVQALVSRNWSEVYQYPLNKLTHFIVTGGGASLVGSRLQVDGPQVIIGGNFDVVNGYKVAREVMR